MALIIIIKVIPSSGRQAWSLDAAGNLKCHLKSQPEKGQANKELLKLLAGALRVEQRLVSILAGDKTRTKKIKIDAPLTFNECVAKLGLEVPQKQQAIFK